MRGKLSSRWAGPGRVEENQTSNISNETIQLVALLFPSLRRNAVNNVDEVKLNWSEHSSEIILIKWSGNWFGRRVESEFWFRENLLMLIENYSRNLVEVIMSFSYSFVLYSIRLFSSAVALLFYYAFRRLIMPGYIEKLLTNDEPLALKTILDKSFSRRIKRRNWCRI